MGMRLKNGNWSDALADTPQNQAAYGASSNYTGGAVGYNGPSTAGSPTAQSPSPSPSTPAAQNPGATFSAPGVNITGLNGSQSQQLIDAYNAANEAIASGNKAAADEKIREYNATLQQAQDAMMGTSGGQQTLAAQQQAANIAQAAAGLTGTYNGQATLAAEKQASDLANQTAQFTGYNAQGQAGIQEQQLGLDALKAQAAMQNDPFRQQQYLYGLGAGGYNNAINAMNGTAGFAASAGAMGLSAAGTNTLGYLGNQVQGYANSANGPSWSTGANGQLVWNPGTVAPGSMTIQGASTPASYDPAHMAQFYANTMGGSAPTQTLQSGAQSTPNSQSPMGTGTSTYNASLSAMPDPNQVVARNYLKAPTATQNFLTSGISAKTGLDQSTIDQQIKATMPGFNAPSFGLVNI